MQLKASIDESDLGSIKDGQAVTFHVDAYPNDVFHGAVQQVRLNPVIESNVVTYAAIVSAPNLQLKLKPGMTATLTVEVARRDNVLRVPSAALRFKPTASVLAALNQPVENSESHRRASGQWPPRALTRRGGNRGTIWTYDGERLRQVQVTTGVSDATYTEVVDGDVHEGEALATRVTLPGNAAGVSAPPSNSTNPLMGPQGPRRM